MPSKLTGKKQEKERGEQMDGATVGGGLHPTTGKFLLLSGKPPFPSAQLSHYIGETLEASAQNGKNQYFLVSHKNDRKL